MLAGAAVAAVVVVVVVGAAKKSSRGGRAAAKAGAGARGWAGAGTAEGVSRASKPEGAATCSCSTHAT